MASEIRRNVGWVLRELDSYYEPTDLETRADNAYGVSIKLFDLIERMIPGEEDQKRLMASWFKAVRDRDFKKFRKALRRYDNRQKAENTTP